MDLLQQQQQLQNNLDWANNLLKTYIDGRRDEMGLVIDEIKTPLYHAIKSEADKAFQDLRTFNGKHIEEINKLRRSRTLA
jgi:hypothetical protein